MSKHTPEPWYAYQREHPVGYSFGICNSRPCGTLVDEDGSLHTDFPDWNPGTSELVARTYDSENAHANANRIVACVNACAGMDDPAAEITTLRLRVAEYKLAHEGSEAVIHMAIARMGGLVEGRPTHRGNFLQRIDELVRKEKA